MNQLQLTFHVQISENLWLVEEVFISSNAIDCDEVVVFTDVSTKYDDEACSLEFGYYFLHTVPLYAKTYVVQWAGTTTTSLPRYVFLTLKAS